VSHCPNSPPGVNVLWFESVQQVADHMIMCAKQVGNPITSGEADLQASAIAEGVTSYLAALWGQDPHDIEFLLAARSLHSLACVTSEEAWKQLLVETQGLLSPDLLYVVISWLQDSEQLEIGL
jgi:hypothetical protein